MKRSRLAIAVFGAALVASYLATVGQPAVGAAGLNNGVGTAAALQNPNCDPQTKQIKILLIARAPCVRHVTADENGGVTSPGVTHKSVKVVIVAAADPTTVPSDVAGAVLGGTNQATGKTGTLTDA